MFNPFNKKRVRLPERDLDSIKQITHILFIDDHKFDVEDILKRSGWVNTRRIRDVDSLDQSEVSQAHIIFIDINGVGKRMEFKDEGLGLTVALREKYPNKKLITYSADSHGDRFHEGLSVADARLSKNADPYEFQTLVEKFSKEAFSLNECVERMQKLLLQELGYSIETAEIIKKMQKLYKKGKYDFDAVSNVFNLQNAAALANIIQLFFLHR